MNMMVEMVMMIVMMLMTKIMMLIMIMIIILSILTEGLQVCLRSKDLEALPPIFYLIQPSRDLIETVVPVVVEGSYA